MSEKLSTAAIERGPSELRAFREQEGQITVPDLTLPDRHNRHAIAAFGPVARADAGDVGGILQILS